MNCFTFADDVFSLYSYRLNGYLIYRHIGHKEGKQSGRLFIQNVFEYTDLVSVHFLLNSNKVFFRNSRLFRDPDPDRGDAGFEIRKLHQSSKGIYRFCLVFQEIP